MRTRTSKQILAARINGARSRGPKTAEGKRRSSLNAIRPGLFSKIVVLQNESTENFRAMLARHMARLAPGVEQNAIEEMVSAALRVGFSGCRPPDLIAVLGAPLLANIFENDGHWASLYARPRLSESFDMSDKVRKRRAVFRRLARHYRFLHGVG